jgi:hypothetical protein
MWDLGMVLPLSCFCANRGRGQQRSDNFRFWRPACDIEKQKDVILCLESIFAFLKKSRFPEETACFSDIFLESPSSRIIDRSNGFAKCISETVYERILGGSVAMSESSQKEPAPEDRYLKKMAGIIKTGTHRERIDALLLRIKARLPELEELARTLEKAEEDGVYRFYDG